MRENDAAPHIGTARVAAAHSGNPILARRAPFPSHVSISRECDARKPQEKDPLRQLELRLEVPSPLQKHHQEDSPKPPGFPNRCPRVGAVILGYRCRTRFRVYNIYLFCLRWLTLPFRQGGKGERRGEGRLL